MKSFKYSLVVLGFLLFLSFHFLMSPFFFYFLNMEGLYRNNLIVEWESLLRVATYLKGAIFIVGSLFFSAAFFVYWQLSRRFIRPMQQILDGIFSHKEGREEDFSPIVLQGPYLHHEFEKLAGTFNSLIERVRSQVDHVTQQGKETQAILESLNEGVIAFDASAEVTFANRVAYSILGMTSPSLLGISLVQISSVNRQFLQSCHDLVLRALQTFEAVSCAKMFDLGEMRYLDLIALPMMHPGGAILVLQDKTADQKILEMGKNFVANASHELRTPITIIRGFAETLQDVPNLSLQKRKEIIEKIVSTCGRLDNLVKSLLTIADVENFSKKRFRLCDFKMVLDHCQHLLLMAHPTVRMTVDSPSHPMWILADSDLLDLAVMNILENAVKYSPETALIEIGVQQKEKWIEVEIKDHGMGIPREDLPHIFDRFYTVNKAHSRKLGGAGLGLSIVKTIIEKHQGKILAESVLGSGTVLTMKLPLGVIQS